MGRVDCFQYQPDKLPYSSRLHLLWSASYTHNMWQTFSVKSHTINPSCLFYLPLTADIC